VLRLPSHEIWLLFPVKPCDFSRGPEYRIVTAMSGVFIDSDNHDLLTQLRTVFNACDTEGTGQISLKELANISRSHVDNAQLEQVLEILDPGDGSQDKMDFDQFYDRFTQFMSSEENLQERVMPESRPSTYSPTHTHYNPSYGNTKVQGVFNENLKRSFEKNMISTPALHHGSGDKKQKNIRRLSQVRLTGRIPLVNTSSEDEAEDSFDKKIASSLALARPMDIQPQFLVRGGSSRSTIRKNANKSSKSSPNLLGITKGSPSSSIRMYPVMTPSEESSLSSPRSCSSSPSERSGHESSHRGNMDTRLVLDDLERQVDRLAESRSKHQDEYDSHSSGLGSLKADLEEEISNSLLLTKKHGEERLASEREKHAEHIESLQRERDLERRNFQLRFEMFQEDQDRLKKEVENLKEKVKLINLEKESLETQIVELADHKKQTQQLQAIQEMEDDQRRKDREEELMNTVQRLTERVQNQDQELAEAKEDNIVLRNQLRNFKELKVKDGLKFKIFGGGKENSGITEDSNESSDLRQRLLQAEQDLIDQKEANNQLKQYVGEVLVNIMVKNPQILQKD